jgi:hypothetical protein
MNLTAFARDERSQQTRRWREVDSNFRFRARWRLHRHVIVNHRTAVR